MLKGLRIQLTILYFVAALGLIAMISTGANLLLRYYFQKQTDLALSYKMALAFQQYNLSYPTNFNKRRKTICAMTPHRASRKPKPRRSMCNQIIQVMVREKKTKPNCGLLPFHRERQMTMKRNTMTLSTHFVLPVDAQGNLLTIQQSISLYP
jgi:hypothetical protein